MNQTLPNEEVVESLPTHFPLLQDSPKRSEEDESSTSEDSSEEYTYRSSMKGMTPKENREYELNIQAPDFHYKRIPIRDNADHTFRPKSGRPDQYITSSEEYPRGYLPNKHGTYRYGKPDGGRWGKEDGGRDTLYDSSEGVRYVPKYYQIPRGRERPILAPYFNPPSKYGRPSRFNVPHGYDYTTENSDGSVEKPNLMNLLTKGQKPEWTSSENKNDPSYITLHKAHLMNIINSVKETKCNKLHRN